MAERGRKRYTVGEVFEAVFVDKGSDHESCNCGSDVEFITDSLDDSVCEESDLEDSVVMPHSSYSHAT